MEKQEKRNVQVPKAEFVTRLLRLPRGISRLEKYGQKRKVPKDYMLVEAGDIPKHCFIIKTGRAICYEYSISGEERIYNFNENNPLLMESYVLFDTVVPVNVKTVLPSEIIFIDKGKIVFDKNKNDLLSEYRAVLDKEDISIEDIMLYHIKGESWNDF